MKSIYARVPKASTWFADRSSHVPYKWSDVAMIAFFASRPITFLLTQILGNTVGLVSAVGIIFVLTLFAWIMTHRKEMHGKRATVQFLYVALVFVLVAVLTMLANTLAKEWMLSFQYGLLTQVFDPRKGIFALLLILLVRDEKRLLRNFDVSASILFVYLFIQWMAFKINGSWSLYYVLEDARSVQLSYNLTFGYEMIFVSIVFLTIFLQRRSKIRLVLGLIAAFIGFVYGSRGVIVCLGMFVLMTLMRYIADHAHRWTRAKKQKIWMGVAVIIVLVIGVSLLLHFKVIDVSTFSTGSRSLDMLLRGELFDDNGRSKLWGIVVNGIRESFPFGYGLYGERPFVGQRFKWGYSHNIFLELVVNFGLIGVILCGLLVYGAHRLIWAKDTQRYLWVSFILLSMNSKLLISDSLWSFDFFWAGLGLFIVVKDRQRWETAKTDRVPRRRRVSMKTHAGLLCALFVLNLALFGVVVARDVRTQTYRALRFDKPTAVLMLQDMSARDYDTFMGIARRKQMPLTVCPTPAMAQRLSHAISKEDLPDVQLGLPPRDVFGDQEAGVAEFIESYRGKPPYPKAPYAVSTTWQEFAPYSLIETYQRSDATILGLKLDRNYYYRSLMPCDFHGLEAMNASFYMRRETISGGDYISQQMTSITEDGGIILLYFKTPNDVAERSPFYGTEELRQFYDILAMLENHHFDTITVTQLLERARLAPEEKTLKTLIRNSDIVVRLLGVK
ncbi:MAG: O-antigen ligase family protein [Saccharofermentanales bacterium]